MICCVSIAENHIREDPSAMCWTFSTLHLAVSFSIPERSVLGFKVFSSARFCTIRAALRGFFSAESLVTSLSRVLRDGSTKSNCSYRPDFGNLHRPTKVGQKQQVHKDCNAYSVAAIRSDCVAKNFERSPGQILIDKEKHRDRQHFSYLGVYASASIDGLIHGQIRALGQEHCIRNVAKAAKSQVASTIMTGSKRTALCQKDVVNVRHRSVHI